MLLCSESSELCEVGELCVMVGRGGRDELQHTLRYVTIRDEAVLTLQQIAEEK
jgi:hypothetical protein